ncbi:MULTISPECIES: cytochrome aa3 quinol oxidase subunit IV [Bacillaceae]|jgi:cytochrome aa3-600 menaquinol oxidase subunit 4|uniref:Quinol oxidase subunit 4 n=2 Tax=Gottfriedia TaxID=2837503 RepID=A0ABY4JHJ6_9BACI|nr:MULTISPECIES: cytochrome aa3 quinol oxidase subunit IV [Bacillaceae]ODG89685.1 cytochrome aa3 quinol oxidase subunit IV [Gottfriedia luciferensis]PET71844.1 cytochrome aa3 quinol oxidase subunit IV [Bacillus sp. AFS001701]PGZ92580.1 cytochrome aa3 quinol oxidase subunit IV [Bacillus sp. AFS029533]UPM53294.1 cytochrome aa3 quinol oxidase subunit IV [Gottfriedia acidiceleris]SFC71159.1 cytochrome aa3-600 menaquinol oxidase subunit 4 [Bacillus sp. UNCCL81]
MSALFPKHQVVGFIQSLVLTIIALSVYYLNLPFNVSFIILIVTALLQGGLQLIVFMHMNENENKGVLYINLGYAVFIAVAIVFGTLWTLIWGM